MIYFEHYIVIQIKIIIYLTNVIHSQHLITDFFER